MGLDGLDADLEPMGDLLVHVAAGDEAQDLALAVGELVERRVGGGRRGAGERVEDEARQPRREDGVARGDPLHRVGELDARDRLRHVAAGARADDRDDVVGVVGDRQREEPVSGLAGPARRITSTPPRRACGRRAGRPPAACCRSWRQLPRRSPPLHDLHADRRARCALLCERARDRPRGRRVSRRAPHRQLDLGALAGPRRDARVSAETLHPPDDRLAHAAAVGGHGVASKPAPRSRTKTSTSRVVDLGEQVDTLRARELRSVQDRLARRGDERVERARRGARRRRSRPRR